VTRGNLRVWRFDPERSQVSELKIKLPLTPTPAWRTVLFLKDASSTDYGTLILGRESGKMDIVLLDWSTPSPRTNPASRSVEPFPPQNKQKALAPVAPGPTSEQRAVPASELSTQPEIETKIIPSPTMQGTDELDFQATPPSDPRRSRENEGNVVSVLDPSRQSIYWVAGDSYLRAWWLNVPDSMRENWLPDQPSRLLVKAHEMATALAVGPSGCWLATGGVDHATRLWRINTADLIAKKLLPIKAVAVDPRGGYVAVGHAARRDKFETRIWSDGAVHFLNGLKPDEEPRSLSDDGSFLVFASLKGARVFDVRASKWLPRVEGLDLEGAFGFSGSIVAVQSKRDPNGLTVTLWDAKAGKELGTFQAADKRIVDIMFGSGRGLVAVAAQDHQLKIWNIQDPAKPKEVKSMSITDAAIVFIAFASDDNVLAAACDDNSVHLFDAKSGTQTATIPIPESDPTTMTFNAKGTLLAIALENGAIKIWDCVKRQLVREIPPSETGADALAFTAGNELVIGGSDGVIRVFDPAGRLVKMVGASDWRPKNADDAARLSGLKLDGLDVRFLEPGEEQRLRIDDKRPLENRALAEYWRAAQMTRRNFAALQKSEELEPGEVAKADLLAIWLYAHQSSSEPEIQARAAIARDVHDSLFSKFATDHEELGIDALFRHDNARALTIFEQILQIIPEDGTGKYRAWRGFARHSAGDERGATEDREAYLKSESGKDMEKRDEFLPQGDLTAERLQVAGSVQVWLYPNYANGYYWRAQSNLVMKHYDEALVDVNAAIRLYSASMKRSDAANVPMTSDTALLLLLHGRVLDAQHSLNARKDWQQVADHLGADDPESSPYVKALAHLFLGKFDSKHFEVAQRYFDEQTSKYPTRSSSHYNLARFFAVRSASHADKKARSEDVTAAIEALRKSGYAGHELRTRLVWEPDFDALQDDERFKALLKEEERVGAAPPSVDSE
jgi:WD40 repeat protein/tetratricopeptide (TPR) repeat protein